MYKHNQNLILLLLYGNLIYYIKNYKIDLKVLFLRLNQKNKIKNFLKFKNK